ncbi:hypothetical protein LXL04_036847 [Taraxacum kok-saghyz]
MVTTSWFGQAGRSQWWARGDDHNYNEDDENISERSFEEHEQQGFNNWRSEDRLLSRTFYMEDIEGGKFNLPFDDIYDRSSQSPPRNV